MTCRVHTKTNADATNNFGLRTLFGFEGHLKLRLEGRARRGALSEMNNEFSESFVAKTEVIV